MGTIDSQNQMILEHMKTKGAITQGDAAELYGCMRLASRINDLRRKGTPILTIMTEGRNRYGKPIRYARYILHDGAYTV